MVFQMKDLTPVSANTLNYVISTELKLLFPLGMGSGSCVSVRGQVTPAYYVLLFFNAKEARPRETSHPPLFL